MENDLALKQTTNNLFSSWQRRYSACACGERDIENEMPVCCACYNNATKPRRTEVNLIPQNFVQQIEWQTTAAVCASCRLYIPSMSRSRWYVESTHSGGPFSHRNLCWKILMKFSAISFDDSCHMRNLIIFFNGV